MPAPRLLVVDDEAPIMHALVDTLRRQGYDAVGASAPDEALVLLRQNRFDLLLTDLKMPGMDGVELLREALVIDPLLVAIMMTGHGTIDTAIEAMKAGALDYILKPFKFNELHPILDRALTMRRLRLENEELQGRLRARTAELEAANQELEAFSDSVSHDLRTPLRAIDGFVVLIEQEMPGISEEDLRLYLQHVRNGVGRMQALIDDLLRLSRVSRAQLNHAHVDLGRMAREIIAKLPEPETPREVEWVIGEPLFAEGDPSLLYVALENLLSNAFKYTGHTPRARISFETETGAGPGNGQIVYRISDNGAGFDMKYAGRLFRPFERLHSPAQFPGTGVGLATVHRIIQKHGGRIWAEAVPGEGATFRFTLPPANASLSPFRDRGCLAEEPR